MDLTHLPLWATLLLLLGLITRVTRLVTTDTITQPIRTALTSRTWEGVTANPDGTFEKTRKNKVCGWFAELTDCNWCSGVWVAAAATVSAQLWADTQAWNLVALGATLAWAAAWILSEGWRE